jgi:hypothetical protein
VRIFAAALGASTSVALIAFASCGGGGGASSSPSPDATTPSDAALPLDAGAMDSNAGDADAGPSVVVQGGQLVIDGKPTFLYGGDVHYFRVRDSAFDAAKTQALWRDTIDKMRASGMNLVTTYFAWDYHAPSSGNWDFTGARDIDAFLKIACDAGMYVVVKPGPLITAEWPGGFGTFGAVPVWWKQAHPDALVKKSDGSTFTFSLTGDATQSQPTYMHADYLAAVGDWFDRALPIVRPYVDKRCVVGIQVDNETNLYWSNRFGDVDYSTTALGRYASFLTSRYGSIAALNAAYGTAYSNFAAVAPPSSVPSSAKGNVAARDWYDAGQAYVAEYLKTIRAMIEARGITEPKVLFFTNDSPFGAPTRNVLVHDPRVKNRVGLAALDLYPRQLPTTSALNDAPFQADYFAKLYALGDLLYTGDVGGRFAYAAELQGGMYSLPLGVQATVAPESTDQLVAKSFGHGVKGGSFYVVRGGLNADGSSYDYQAAIGLDGSLRPRYDVMKKWGAFLARYGAALESSDEIEDPIAIVQDVAYAVPQAGTNDDLQAMYTSEYNATFGWLMNAGFNAMVVDPKIGGDLAQAKAAFFLAPEIVDDATAAKLVAFHAAGGVLVQLLDSGSRALDGSQSANDQALAALFAADANGSYTWPGVGLRSGAANQHVDGGDGTLTSYWYETYWTPRADAGAPFLVERTQPLGNDGRAIGFVASTGGAARALIGTYVASVFNDGSYYGADDAELGRKRALARYLAGLAGVTPTVSARGVHEEAWARRARGTRGATFVFVVNDHAAGTVHVDIGSLAALGLDAQATYAVSEALSGAAVGDRTGAQISASGFDVAMAQYGTAVIVIEAK